ncbi:MAG TPA: PAS domain S-box protein [Pyrinomonadaceae bacterium]|jgi:PAS domain S-box-containing protein|nr:PAS domain S-box protein [Pyrinomonadaceae bacterium]
MGIREEELEGLKEAEARGRAVMETVADALVTIDEGSVIRSVNPAAERIFGYGAGEMLGEHLAMLMPDYLRRLHEAGMRRYMETGVKHISWAGVELPALHRDGREIPVEVSFGEFRFKGRRYFTGVIRDISARRRNERRLRAQYEVTRALAEAASFREAAPAVLRAVCHALDWQVGVMWRVDAEAETLGVVETWHADGLNVEEFERISRRSAFPRGEGVPGLVWRTGEPTWVEDMAADSFPRSTAAERTGLHGAFAFPVKLRGEVLGVIEFFSREVRPPDEPLLQMMASVGTQLGQFLERRREQAERERLQAEVIRLQDEQLAELSTPLIPLTERVMLMPLVGKMDRKRAGRMIDTLLRELERTRVPVAIIDITGVGAVDAHVADTLVRAAHTARLLGTRVVLTGIRAGVSRSLVRLGADLTGINTGKTLQDGINCALEYLRRDAAGELTD